MSTAGSGRRRVLFVEDEPGISEPFSKALAREGFEPVVATTVARALALAADEDFDFVLLDLSLPDGDGRDVAVALRRRSSVPILILTARGTETDRIVGLELGADDYVVKPFSGAEVIARMRAILRRSAPAEAAAPPTEPLHVGELALDPAARRVTLHEAPGAAIRAAAAAAGAGAAAGTTTTDAQAGRRAREAGRATL